MAGTVPLHPDSFAADGGLLDLSMEEVVALFLDKERHRRREARDDEEQQVSIISTRSTPVGLVAALTAASHQLNVSRSMLTRCLSHQVAVWYDNLGDLRELTTAFYDAYQKAVSHGHPDLCDGVREVGYSFNSSLDRPNTFKTIRWVREKLSNASLPLGLPVSTLFSVGLCKAVSTSASGLYEGTIDKYLRAEVDRFVRHVGERGAKIRLLHALVLGRLGV